jgi:nucleoside-diphosphate kinase
MSRIGARRLSEIVYPVALRFRPAGGLTARVEAPRGARYTRGNSKGRHRRPNPQLEWIVFMAVERTLSIIKPDATRRNLTGKINARFEEKGLRIVAQKRLQLTQAQAEAFYAVHKARPFFGELVSFMISGPVVAQVLEGDNAVAANRDIMGATDPKKAAPGTIRKDFAESIEANSVHGSDSAENAATEIAFFFAGVDIVP